MAKRVTKRSILTAVLSVLMFAGLVWALFLREPSDAKWNRAPSGKSCLYLYPEEETECRYSNWMQNDRDPFCALWLTPPEEAGTVSGPEYFRLLPDGTIVSDHFCEADHRFLWDRVGQITYPGAPGRTAVVWWGQDRLVQDLSVGWCVPASEIRTALGAILPRTGLSETECADLLAAWVPELRGHAYYQLTFHIEHTPLAIYDCYPNGTTLLPGDRVKSVLRVFLLVLPLDAPVELEPQAFEPFAREGFTAVQWGGVILEN